MNNITLELQQQNWVLKIVNEHDGIKYKKRIRSKKDINNFLETLSSPDRILVGINDMSLYYDDCVLVLKNYQKNKNTLLYKKISNKIGVKTKKINVLSANVDKIFGKSKNQKLLLVKSAVATILLSSSIAIASFAMNNSNDVSEPIENVTTITDEIEPVEIAFNEIQQPTTNSNTIVNDTPIHIIEIDVPVEEFNINEHIILTDRISQVKNIQDSNLKGIYNIGNELNEYGLNKMVSHIEKNGQAFYDASSKYGVDPYLLTAIAMAESSCNHVGTLPGGNCFNGNGYGEMQIENKNFGGTISAFNYQTGEYDTIQITKECVKDFYTNVQIGAMKMQKNLERFNGNVYMAIQAYNYGIGMMDIIVQKYADEIGKTFEEVTLDINDFGWLKYVDDVHYNPKKYVSNWEYPTYGKNVYIQRVLKYYMGEKVVNNLEDNYYILDLINNTYSLENKSLQSRTK